MLIFNICSFCSLSVENLNKSHPSPDESLGPRDGKGPANGHIPGYQQKSRHSGATNHVTSRFPGICKSRGKLADMNPYDSLYTLGSSRLSELSPPLPAVSWDYWENSSVFKPGLQLHTVIIIAATR